MKTLKRKKCSKCKKIKDLDDFSPCKTGKHGRYNYCRECQRLYWSSKNPNRQEIDEKDARRTGLKKLGLKTCASCKSVLPLDDFYDDSRHTDHKQSYCKECCNNKANARYLYREYGISLDEFKLLMDFQQGKCAICGRTPKKFKFNVDHDHSTHQIRGLLCVNCNTNLLPYVEKFPEWIKGAFLYLESPPAILAIGKKEVPPTNQSRYREKQENPNDEVEDI